MNPTLPLLSLSLLLTACASTEPATGQPQPVSQALPTADAVQDLADNPPPESDLPPTTAGSWSLACGSALELEGGGTLQLLERDGLRPVGGQAVGAPAVDQARRRIAWSHAPQARPETVVSVLACDGDRWTEPRSIVDGPGSPDRVAISPDGAWVFWFSSASGLPSLWASPFEQGDATQLTNIGLARPAAVKASDVRADGSAAAQRRPAPGPPEGFVAPPHRGPPVVEAIASGGYRVTWQAPDGMHSVELAR